MTSAELNRKVGYPRPFTKAHEDMHWEWRQLGNTMHVNYNTNCWIGNEYIGKPRNDSVRAAISNDGNRVAFHTPRGKLRVFDFDGTSWNEVVSFSGPCRGIYGTIIALSGDGTRLAIGGEHARGERRCIVDQYEKGIGWRVIHCRGYVEVHQCNEEKEWKTIGNELVGLGVASVSFSGNGSRIAIGGIFDEDRNGPREIGVRIFELLSDEFLKEIWQNYAGGSDWSALVKDFLGNGWQQIGQTIIIADKIDWYMKGAMSLSSDGNVVAVKTRERTSIVRVFRYSSGQGQWIQIGQKLYGNAKCHIIGEKLSLNAEGNIMAVSARGYNHRYVRVFSLNGDKWNEIGNISMEFPFQSLSLSSNGNTIAVAFCEKNYVGTFKYDGNDWVPTKICKQHGEYIGTSTSLSSDGNRLAVASVLNKTAHLHVYKFM